jgi:ribosomal protein S18 acetylase RimI-like enzyme
MAVRALESQDFPALLELLRLTDERPQYRAMAPESRSVEDLELELSEGPFGAVSPWVLEQSGRVNAYVSLCRYQGEAFLEGPLMRPELAPETSLPLLECAVREAKAQGYGFIDAFVDEENRRAQDVLERAHFEPFHTTYIYELSKGANLEPLSPSQFRFDYSGATGAMDVSLYRDLYRDTSDNWATRLGWSDEELLERFEDPDVTLILAYQAGEIVGHLELERITEENVAEIAYFGVLPAARGQGLGLELVLRGVRAAFASAESVDAVLARAHDDERAACHTLERAGFRLLRGVMAFTHELE